MNILNQWATYIFCKKKYFDSTNHLYIQPIIYVFNGELIIFYNDSEISFQSLKSKDSKSCIVPKFST